MPNGEGFPAVSASLTFSHRITWSPTIPLRLVEHIVHLPQGQTSPSPAIATWGWATPLTLSHLSGFVVYENVPIFKSRSRGRGSQGVSLLASLDRGGKVTNAVQGLALRRHQAGGKVLNAPQGLAPWCHQAGGMGRPIFERVVTILGKALQGLAFGVTRLRRHGRTHLWGSHHCLEEALTGVNPLAWPSRGGERSSLGASPLASPDRRGKVMNALQGLALWRYQAGGMRCPICERVAIVSGKPLRGLALWRH